MMGQLERRTETISGESNSKEVANTIWTYPTMGRKPGDRMMGQLGQGRRQYQGSSSRRLLQTRFGRLQPLNGEKTVGAFPQYPDLFVRRFQDGQLQHSEVFDL